MSKWEGHRNRDWCEYMEANGIDPMYVAEYPAPERRPYTESATGEDLYEIVYTAYEEAKGDVRKDRWRRALDSAGELKATKMAVREVVPPTILPLPDVSQVSPPEVVKK